MTPTKAEPTPGPDTGVSIWIINIGGYGAFVFRGDKDDCEHMMRGKASWEGGSGQMWLASEGLHDDRANKTARALLSAVTYPHSVADASNYGPSPKKAALAAANPANPHE